MNKLLRTPKGLLTVVFLGLLAAAGSVTGWSVALPHVLFALAGACIVDLVAHRIVDGRWAAPTSALLSGLIVAFVLGVETAGVVTVAVAALASASKYLLRTHRGHVFNPAGLALLLAIPLFATGQSWWGAFGDMPAYWVALLVVGGALILDKVNKFPMALAFLGSYFGLFTVAAFANPSAVAEMFRAPFLQATLFLAFFMVTDPPTSPGKATDQLWMGALVGVVSVFAQLLGAGQGYLLVGLLVGNVALMVQRRAQEGRRRPSSPRQLSLGMLAT